MKQKIKESISTDQDLQFLSIMDFICNRFVLEFDISYDVVTLFREVYDKYHFVEDHQIICSFVYGHTCTGFKSRRKISINNEYFVDFLLDLILELKKRKI